MGTSMVAAALRAARASSAASPRSRAGALLAFGPSYLYFSRFAREDIYIAAITLAMLVVAFRFLDGRGATTRRCSARCWRSASPPRRRRSSRSSWPARFFLIAIVVAVARAHGGCARRRSCARCSASAGRRAWGARRVPRRLHARCSRRSSRTRAASTGSGPASTTGSASTASAAAASRRSSTPSCCSADEWPVLLLGAVGAVVAFRRPTLLRLFLVWAFVLSLAVYSWAGEKFAWLVLHPLLPLILLAGVGVQAIWETRRHAGTASAGLAVAALALAYTVYASFAGQRRAPRRPARAARLHAVLDRGRQAGRRPGRRAAPSRRGGKPQGHGRLRRGRDVPVGLVLPPPRRRLHRPRRPPAPRRRRPT